MGGWRIGPAAPHGPSTPAHGPSSPPLAQHPRAPACRRLCAWAPLRTRGAPTLHPRMSQTCACRARAGVRGTALGRAPTSSAPVHQPADCPAPTSPRPRPSAHCPWGLSPKARASPEPPRPPAVVVHHDLRLHHRAKHLEVALEILCAVTCTQQQQQRCCLHASQQCRQSPSARAPPSPPPIPTFCQLRGQPAHKHFPRTAAGSRRLALGHRGLAVNQPARAWRRWCARLLESVCAAVRGSARHMRWAAQVPIAKTTRSGPPVVQVVRALSHRCRRCGRVFVLDEAKATRHLGHSVLHDNLASGVYAPGASAGRVWAGGMHAMPASSCGEPPCSTTACPCHAAGACRAPRGTAGTRHVAAADQACPQIRRAVLWRAARTQRASSSPACRRALCLLGCPCARCSWAWGAPRSGPRWHARGPQDARGTHAHHVIHVPVL